MVAFTPSLPVCCAELTQRGARARLQVLWESLSEAQRRFPAGQLFVRSFDLASDRINMAGYWQASHPKPVREAIERHRRGLDQCPSEYYENSAPRLEASIRSAAAEYLGAKADDFALTKRTSQD